MRGPNSWLRFAGVGPAIVLFAGVGVAIALFAGRSQPPSSARPVRPDDQREAGPLAAALVTAIRNGDVQFVRKLPANGADVNARDAEGNTPLIPPAAGCGRSRRKRLRKRSFNCSVCTGRASRPRSSLTWPRRSGKGSERMVAGLNYR